jgi:hypothetical protein
MKIIRNFKKAFVPHQNDRFIKRTGNKINVLQFRLPQHYEVKTDTQTFNLEFSENGCLPVNNKTDEVIFNTKCGDVESDWWFNHGGDQFVVFLAYPSFCCFKGVNVVNFFKLDENTIEDAVAASNDCLFQLNYHFLMNENGSRESSEFNPLYACFEIFVEYSFEEQSVTMYDEHSAFRLNVGDYA